MGLFDKLKNIFIEEEEIEEEIPTIKKVEKIEKTEPVIREVSKEEMAVKEKPVINKVISDRELTDTSQKFKFPIIFEDDDFVEEKRTSKSINVLERENTKYEPEIKKDVRPQKKVFKPSLVISPVYGVLDKNYSKDEITAKNGLLSDSTDIDIDTVIKKAYGEEVEVISREEKNKKVKEEEKDLSVETENIEPVVEEISVGLNVQEEEKDELDSTNIDEKIKSIDELLKDTSDDDFYSLVDSMYKDEEEEEKE